MCTYCRCSHCPQQEFHSIFHLDQLFMKFLGKNLYNLAARLAHCAIEGEKKTEEKYFKHFSKHAVFPSLKLTLWGIRKTFLKNMQFHLIWNLSELPETFWRWSSAKSKCENGSKNCSKLRSKSFKKCPKQKDSLHGVKKVQACCFSFSEIF